MDGNKLTANNLDKDGNVKVGYVGAYNYAEVVSGYTAFYLGIKSVYPTRSTMYVDYTQSWFDVDKEAAMAEKFIGDGCVIIGQHADSTGAPSACEAAFQEGHHRLLRRLQRRYAGRRSGCGADLRFQQLGRVLHLCIQVPDRRH
jgi:hypothetical protein